MPTFETTHRFTADLAALSPTERTRFQQAVLGRFLPDLTAGRFRAGLRVKAVQGAAGVFEMTWAPDGRATFQYGEPRLDGHIHVIWRRVGSHAIFDRAPGP